MTQLGFDNIRNLGANSNQPLITNQNDFQLFDSLTKVSGKHTMKVGGSITWRSREILNADTIVGNFRYNANLTSNCAGVVTACTLNTGTGFDFASFMLGYAATKTRNLFDAETYTEKRPEYAVYVQDDFRASNKLTLNLGLRWDLFVPWVEKDDRQSNFDVTTGKFVVASPDAVMDGVKVGRYLQTYSKKDFGPRFGFAYDMGGNGRTVLRGGVGVFWNFTPGGTSSSKAQNPPFLQSTALTSSFLPTLKTSDGLPPPPGVDPSRPAAGSTRSIFDINFRDAYSTNFNLNIQKQLGRNYLVEIAYVGSRARDMLVKVNPNQAPPVLGVRSADVNRPFIGLSPQLRDVGTGQQHGLPELQRAAGEVPAPVRERVLVPELVHLRPGHGPQLRQRRRRDPGQRVRPRLQPRARGLRRQAHVRVELGVRVALRQAEQGLRRLAGERHPVRAHGARPDHQPDARACSRPGPTPASSGGNRPNRLADNINNSDQNIDHWFDPAAFRRSCRRRRRPTAAPAATSRADRATSTST